MNWESRNTKSAHFYVFYIYKSKAIIILKSVQFYNLGHLNKP